MMKHPAHAFYSMISVFLFLFLLLPVQSVKADMVTQTWNDFTFHYETLKDKSPCVILDTYQGTDSDLVIPEKITGYPVKSTPKTYAHPENIRTITIPRYVSRFEVSEFTNLEAIRVVPENKYLASIDGVLFDTWRYGNGDLLYYPAEKKDLTYKVPHFSSGTGSSSCEINLDNKYLNTLILGKGSYILDKGQCPNLLTLQLDGTEGLGSYNTFKMPALRTFTAKTGLLSLGDYLFSGCKKLRTVKLPDSLTFIGEDVFSDCISLESIKLPDSLKEISYHAFSGCTSLKEIRIPKSVTCLSGTAFYHCPAKILKESYLKKKNGSLDYYALAPVKTKAGTKNYRASNITKIRPEQKKITLSKKQSKKLKTTVFIKANKKGILSPSLLTYRSYDDQIVHVTKKGTLKPLKKGNATIRVTLKTAPLSYKIRIRVK